MWYEMKFGSKNIVHREAQVNKVQANISESIFSSNLRKCNLYALVDGDVTGLGHMYTAVVLTYIYALENDAVPLVDRRKFKVEKEVSSRVLGA